MEARQLLMLASGADKASAIQATLEGPVSIMMPASVMQMHPDVRVILDAAAAAKLEFDHHDGIAEPKG